MRRKIECTPSTSDASQRHHPPLPSSIHQLSTSMAITPQQPCPGPMCTYIHKLMVVWMGCEQKATPLMYTRSSLPAPLCECDGRSLVCRQIESPARAKEKQANVGCCAQSPSHNFIPSECCRRQRRSACVLLLLPPPPNPPSPAPAPPSSSSSSADRPTTRSPPPPSTARRSFRLLNE